MNSYFTASCAHLFYSLGRKDQLTEPCEITSLGVDWISVTTKDADRGYDLLRWANVMVNAMVQSGFEGRPWGMSGFIGLTCGHIQLGTRNQEALVRLGGPLAHLHWRKAYEMADNVTRIDLECTTRSARNAHHRITREVNAARRHSRRQEKGATVTTIKCTDGGYTLYLGKRSSERYGRIYDKFAQDKSEWYLNCVRYEVEYKGNLSKLVARGCYSAKDHNAAIAARLRAFFSARGLDAKWLAVPLFHEVSPQLAPTANSRLRWLRSQVRSSIRPLIDAGMLDQVLSALDLDRHVMIIPKLPVTLGNESKEVH